MDGVIGRVLSVARRVRSLVAYTEVSVQLGGVTTPPTTSDLTGPAGDDSPPIPLHDDVVLFPVEQTGRTVVAGVYDRTNPGQADSGEKHLQSRDATTGVPLAEIWMRKDGSVEVTSAAGKIFLTSEGVGVSNALGEVTLRSDGSVLTKNAFGSSQLNADGSASGSGPAWSWSIDVLGNLVANLVSVSITTGGIVSLTLNFIQAAFFGGSSFIDRFGNVRGIAVQTSGGVNLGTHTHNENDAAPGPTAGPN